MTLARLACAMTLTCTAAAYAQPPAHVVIIGVDGMSPDGIQHANTPHMDRIMREGAYTFHARAVFPSSSSSNWASIITGAGPEQHGVHSNDWRINDYILPPSAMGTGGFFPTIFDQFRRTYPNGVSAALYDWGGFSNLFAHEDLNRAEHLNGPAAVTDAAVDYIEKSFPDLLFIHLDHVDHAGHESGHGTPEYYAAVEEADRDIGRVMNAIEESKFSDSTYILVTADHGGKGKGHGGWTLEEMEIPWLIVGPRVRKRHEISDYVNTYDTAVTASALLGVPPHPAWVGRCVADAFED